MTRADLLYDSTLMTPNAIVVLCPGYNGTGREFLLDGQWQKFAKKNNLGLVTLSFASHEKDLSNGKGYYYVWRESGKIFFIWYISEYQAIYVRIPTMNYLHQHFYLSEIDKIQRKYHPHFAIIDVRYNGGGSDIIALLMIKALLSKPNLGVKYAFLASEYQRKELIRRGRKLDKFQEKEIEFLDKQKFLISNNTPIITENNEAPKVHRIYVLSENVYSAAGTLTSRIAYDNDNIKFIIIYI